MRWTDRTGASLSFELLNSGQQFTCGVKVQKMNATLKARRQAQAAGQGVEIVGCDTLGDQKLFLFCKTILSQSMTARARQPVCMSDSQSDMQNLIRKMNSDPDSALQTLIHGLFLSESRFSLQNNYVRFFRYLKDC